MERFIKYAWGLVSAALLLAGFYAYPYLYFPVGGASAGFWVWYYYIRTEAA